MWVVFCGVLLILFVSGFIGLGCVFLTIGFVVQGFFSGLGFFLLCGGEFVLGVFLCCFALITLQTQK